MKKMSLKLRKIPFSMVMSLSVMALLTSCGAQMEGYTETDGLYYNPKKDVIPEKDWAPKVRNWYHESDDIAMEEPYSITKTSKELKDAQSKKYNKWSKKDKNVSSDWGALTGVERRYIETSPYYNDFGYSSFWGNPYYPYYNYRSLTWNSYFGYDWRFYSPWSYSYNEWNYPYYYGYSGYYSPYYDGYGRYYSPYYYSPYYDSYYYGGAYYPRTYQRKVYRESSADNVKRYESRRNDEGRMLESRIYRSESNNYQRPTSRESWGNTTYRLGDGYYSPSSSSSNSSSSSSNTSNSGGFIKGDFK